MSGRDSVTAIEGGTVGLTPPRSQCKTQSLASSRIPVGGLFFRFTSFAPTLTSDALRGSRGRSLFLVDEVFDSIDHHIDY